MPDDVAARIRARLASGGVGERGPAAAGSSAPRARSGSARARPPYRRRAVLLVAAAAAAAVAVAVPAMLRPAGSGVVRVTGAGPQELWDAAAAGAAPAGPLEDPERARACLRAAGATAPDVPLLAARPHAVDGRAAVLLVLAGGAPGRVRLVVVPPDCGPDRGRVLAETVAGPGTPPRR
ncbi:hypothetical protein [Pseudonocardia spirodelae]|uniref:Uncharacterized protein n=1 Tax=Pseudonocardia spirodelae TaxID=3133431 RepID=A0ABU8TCJ1_9PSEU